MGEEVFIEYAVSYASAEVGTASVSVDEDRGAATCSIDRFWGSRVEDFATESVLETS
jgi:hypothetical protein